MSKGKQRIRFEVRRVRVDADPLEWTWALIAANGEFLAGPHESFKNRTDCVKNLRLVRDTDVDTPVMEIPWVEPIAAGGPVENQRAPRKDPPLGFGGQAGDRPKEAPPAAPAV